MTSSPSSSTGASSARTSSAASASVRSGAKRRLRVTVARSGTTLPATPPDTSTAWSASRYSQPWMTGRRSSNPSTRRRSAPRRWMALRPIHGRAVWARCPRRVISMRSVPWQPASSSPPVGSPRMATSPASRSGRSRTQVGEAVVLGGHLLPRVEDVGHVDGRLGDRLGEGEHHGQPALHVGAAEPPQHVALDAGLGVAVHRHRVGVAGEDHPRRPVELGPGHEVGADPLDLEVREARRRGLEVIGERPPRRGSPTGSPPARPCARAGRDAELPWRTR